MKKIVLIGVILSFFIQPITAQDADVEKYLRRREGVKYPNILKINTVALPFKNIAMTYERAIVPRFSFLIGAGYKYSGDIPKLLTTEGDNIEFDVNAIEGYTITPELRYYVKVCDNRYLDGFYFGLYFRHTKYTTDAKFNYYPDDDMPVEFYSADLAMTEYGAGLSLGYQFILWERLSIDFLLFGPRFSNYHIAYEFNQPASQEFLDDLSGNINEVLDRFGFDYNVELKQDGESRASHSFSFANVRFGLSVGFAF